MASVPVKGTTGLASARPRALFALMFGLFLLGGAATLDPPGRFTSQNPSLHVALDVVEGMIAMLIAYLMVARIRDRGLVSDVLSLYGLAVLGLSKLVLIGIPTVSAGTRGDLELWAAPAGRVVGSVALALAALSETKTVPAPAVKAKLAAGTAVATVAIIAIAATVTRGDAPADPGSPLVLWLHATTAFALAAAALGFGERAVRGSDEMLAWFGAGCALGAVARIGYVLFPPLGADDVYVQDLMRFGFYVLLLVGAQREIALYWRSRTDAAALEERRRVARDLHDGLAQELVFISGQIKRLQRNDPRQELDQLSSAADRAVSEARRAIAALTYPGVQSLSEALEELSDEFTARYPVSVDMTLDPTADLRPSRREEALRIVREAMTNAVRHGNSKVIALKTWNEDGVVIEVTDDGSGFDPSAPRGHDGGFGLISMRERAEGAGGELEIESRPGRGTTVKVRLPSERR